MPSLRHSSDAEPGWTRRRRGRGFSHHDERGRLITDERRLARIRSLAIPPAWRDVWICRSSRGHLQATGIDQAGRKQYRYHPRWSEMRAAEKHDRILRFADRLPELRRIVSGHLRRRRLDREKGLATAVALLDRTLIRVGGEEYARDNGSYGLATMRSRHLDIDGERIVLDFEAKSGQQQRVELESAQLARILAEMDSLPGYEVLKHLDDAGGVVDIRTEDVNAYIKEHAGEEFSAKDFRTWAGTVAAAVALSELEPVASPDKRRRAVAGVCRMTSEVLGNTPAVCRANYIDPRVIDHYLDGTTIASLIRAVDGPRGPMRPEELAVLALLRRGLVERAA